MTIERITKEKAESLSAKFPSLGPIILIKGDSVEYYLIAEDSFLSVNFSVAVVEDGDVSYISDERLRESVLSYIESK